MKRLSFRQVALTLIALQASISTLALIYLLIRPLDTLSLISTVVTTILYWVLFVFYWRGAEWVRPVVVVFSALAVSVFATQGVFLVDRPTATIFAPVMLALVLTNPAWVVGVGVLQIVILLVRAQGGPYAEPLFLMIYLLVVGGMALSRVLTDTAQHAAEESARRTAEALVHSEQQARDLAQKALELEHQNAQQQQLLALVSTLETPVVVLADGVLFAPVVGHLDSRRAQDLTSRLLQAASTHRARLMVVDIAGVAAVDTAVAKALVETARALRLLGCSVTISGISAPVAATLTHLGVALDGIATTRSPQDALTQYSGWQKVTSAN